MTVLPDARRRVPPTVGFLDLFGSIASPRGRGGDLESSLWSAGRLAPNNITYPNNPNWIRLANIPSGIQTGFSDTTVYPNEDVLVSNTGAHNGQLMFASVIQNYGNTSYMIRQPFDIAGRTGTVVFYIDPTTTSALAHYIQFAYTADPIPCPTYVIADNEEPGPVPRQGLILPFKDIQSGQPAGTKININDGSVYDAYTRTALTPTTNLSGVNAPTTEAGKLNRVEIRISTTKVSVYMSDKSDDGVTFPNSTRLSWEDDISLPFTRGYIHIGARNHAAVKFIWPTTTGIVYLDTVSFDTVLPRPRAYEIPDNTTTGNITDDAVEGEITVQNLGYRVSDGTVIAEGVWSPTSLISPLTFTGSVYLGGATSAQLSLNMFVYKDGSPAITTSSGLRYKFNGGTWRTRTFTAGEVGAVNTTSSGGLMGLLIDLTLADLQAGTNTIDFSTVSIPQNFYPMVCNIDLLVHT